MFDTKMESFQSSYFCCQPVETCFNAKPHNHKWKCQGIDSSTTKVLQHIHCWAPLLCQNYFYMRSVVNISSKSSTTNLGLICTARKHLNYCCILLQCEHLLPTMIWLPPTLKLKCCKVKRFDHCHTKAKYKKTSPVNKSGHVVRSWCVVQCSRLSKPAAKKKWDWVKNANMHMPAQTPNSLKQELLLLWAAQPLASESKVHGRTTKRQKWRGEKGLYKKRVKQNCIKFDWSRGSALRSRSPPHGTLPSRIDLSL